MLYRSKLKSVSFVNTALVLICVGTSVWFLWPEQDKVPAKKVKTARRAKVQSTAPAKKQTLNMFGGYKANAKSVATSKKADIKICGIACSDSDLNWAVLSCDVLPGQTVVRVGDVYCGMKVVAIKASGVEFEDRKQKRVFVAFAMFGQAPAKSVKQTKGAENILPAPAKNAGAKRRSDFAFDIEKTQLLSHLASLPDILASATIIPFYQSGKSYGYMLYGMKPDSIFKRIGLKDGDIITHCNGVKLTRDTSPAEFLGILRKDPLVKILVRRNSSTISISYSLR